MGHLEKDTELTPRGDGWEASISPDWRFVVPSGGYLAALALRAAGERATVRNPVSFSCAFVAPPSNTGPLALAVCPLKSGKRAELFRVAASQANRTILEAHVWASNESKGYEHDFVEPLSVPRPPALRPMADYPPEERRTFFPFWSNVEERPYEWGGILWRPPRTRGWYRFTPAAKFENAFVDAARPLILLDALVFPSAVGPHLGPNFRAVGVSFDLCVQFHGVTWPLSEWLYADVEAPISRFGRISGRGRVWDVDNRLVASGSAQMLWLMDPT